MSVAQSNSSGGDIKDAWKAFIQSRFDTSDIRGLGRAASVAALDRELSIVQDNMNAFMSGARKHRNAGVLACVMPPEVLSKIFLYSSRLVNWQPTISPSDRAYDRGWTNVTLVCSFWREVALSTAALWSDVYCFGVPHKAILPYLVRSKDTHLTLRFLGRQVAHHYSEEETIEDLRIWLCRPTCRRFKRLFVYERGNRFMEREWPMLLQQSMPEIEELLIEVSLPTSLLFHALLPEETLAFTHAPKLRNVYLRNVIVPWTSPLWQANLTSLTLILSLGLPGSIESLPTRAKFKEIISHMQSLSILVLENMFPASFDAPTDQIWALPASLTNIRLVSDSTDSARRLFSFFRGVSLSAHTACVVETERGQVLIPGFREALEHIQAGQSPPKSLRLDSRFFEIAPQDVRFPALSKLPKWHDRVVEGTRRFAYSKYSEESNGRRILDLLPRLDLSSLCKVAIAPKVVSAIDAVADWHEYLDLACEVTHLSLQYECDAFTLLCALADVEVESASPALFPKLTSIGLYRPSPPSAQTDRARLYLSLLDVLQNRRRSQMPLEKLYVEKNSLSEEEQARVSQLVQVSRFG